MPANHKPKYFAWTVLHGRTLSLSKCIRITSYIISNHSLTSSVNKESKLGPRTPMNAFGQGFYQSLVFSFSSSWTMDIVKDYRLSRIYRSSLEINHVSSRCWFAFSTNHAVTYLTDVLFASSKRADFYLAFFTRSLCFSTSSFKIGASEFNCFSYLY